MSTRTALAGAILLWPALLLEAERPAASPGEFRDEFRTLDYVETSAGIALARVHPEVPTTPQIRLSPTDLNYGLPEAVARAHRDKMAQVRGEIVGRIQVGDNITPQDLITSWTARAPYLRKPYFPGLLRLQNGDLLAFYSEGMGHGNFAQGRGVMVRSHDGGLHWSPPVAVPDEQDGVRLGFGNSQFQTRDGTVWVTASRRGDNFLLRSTDNGNTWRMAPLTSERIRHLDPAGELSNGDFLWLGSVYLPVQASDAYKDGKASFAATAVLRRAAGDNPDAWDWDVGIHREFPTGFFDEASIVETRTPGRLIVLLRADSHSSYLLQSESDDYGRTWSHPRPSGIWMSEDASRPHLIRMPDGTLVCAEDERALSRTGAHVSFDDGRTWADGDRLLALDSPEYLQGDFAYPKVAALDGHRVLYILYNAFNLDPGKIGLFGRILDLKDLRERYRGVSLMLRNPVRSAGTRGHWMFDEPAGDILYEENDGEHGFLSGARRTRGRFGGGLAFDGSGGYAAIADHPMIQVDNSFTLEAWIKTSTPASTQAILAKRPRYYFGLEGGKLVFAFEGKPHARSDTTLTADRWHHVAVVIKPQPDSTWRSRICFFLDGRLDGCGRVEFQMTRSIGDLSRFLARNDGRVYAGPRFRAITTQQNGPVPTERLYVGIDSDGKSSAFVGNIDEVAVHNGALPDDVLGGHAAAGYDESGELTSTPIELPLGRKWSRFDADFQAPEGAGISFDVFDADGRVIRTGIAPGSSLEDVAESRLRLHARLRSATGSQTPVLRAWRVSWR